MTSLEIEVDVNEAYISRVHPGQPVEAVLDAYPDWRIPGRVITTVPAADRQKATVLVRIGFDQLDSRILPDMGVKVALRDAAADGQAAPAAPRLPRAALRRDGQRDVVFLVSDGRVERRAVTPGRTFGEQIEILAGLRPAERVVVAGPPDLEDGQRVHETEAQPKERR
jgi:multidrug efflux pump subunit AcrA (membrane-fusion protein)